MLLLGALRALTGGEDPATVVDAYLLRLASLAGVRPHLRACASCGQPIGKARLQAFPRATLCVACKQREERR